MPGAVLAEGDAPAMARPRKYSDELRERAVRFYFESNRPIAHVAQDLGIHKEALRQWVRQAAAERGLEGRVRLFRPGARPDPATVTRYVEERRDVFGVEPICAALGVPVSTHYARRSGSSL